MKSPIKNYIPKLYPDGCITQWFGENPDLYAFLELDGHNGIDIVAPYGTPIKAPCDMEVVEIKYDTNGYGSHIKAIGNGYELVFGHLSKIYENIELGCEVKEGEYFCNMGNSGFVVSGNTPFWKYNPYAGTHLHFGVRKFTKRLFNEPYNIQYSTGLQGTIENYNNGFKGSIDVAPLIEDDIIDETEKKKQMMLTVISLSNQLILLLKSLIKKYEKHN